MKKIQDLLWISCILSTQANIIKLAKIVKISFSRYTIKINKTTAIKSINMIQMKVLYVWVISSGKNGKNVISNLFKRNS